MSKVSKRRPADSNHVVSNNSPVQHMGRIGEGSVLSHTRT